ncbi:hypothetical protein [Winogradskyella bathintestinalis]|uniref:hypothetical protein n=1 Tax=Winogradskyella bathintestinalis TaxID=3035208 RepID=UPI002961F139|nr:hypothetical protein [Winogradskyella bathintestinalis]
MLLLSKCFTNDILTDTDPTVMSNFGLLMIIIWGLAYLSVSKAFHSVKWLVLVFAIEKLIYGIIWTNWILNNELSLIYDKDFMAGIFYNIYGLNDLLFFFFFTYVFYKLTKR